MSSKGSKRLSVKQLESALQNLNDFDHPKIELEQYATPPHIAALILNTIDSTFDDIDGRLVADLGCGTGRLSVGSIMCGASFVFGFDMDREALDAGLRNIYNEFDEQNLQDRISGAYLGCGNFNFIQADIVSDDACEFWRSWHNKVDTVIMNPPFGTRKTQGLDMKFLQRAIDMATMSVYSLHKTSTRDHILNKCQQWGVKAKPLAQIKYNLDRTYKFHRKKSVDIDVDLWRIKVCDD